MNFYKHHIGDFDADTAHLSWLEDAAYRRLMCLYYRREQPIPADLAQACRLVRASNKQEREAVETVLREFFEQTPDGWRNKRCDEEIEAAKKKAESNRNNGNKGGRPKRNDTNQKPGGFSLGSDLESQKNLSQTPDTRNTPPPPKGEADPQGFADFWDSWPASPRKVARKQCAEKWRRKGLQAMSAEIVAHVEAMKHTKQWRDGFEPAPLTYLNGERWGDGVMADGQSADSFTEGFV